MIELFKIVSSFLLVLTICSSYANHIVGGELTYTCIDSANSRYRIKLELYRDCAGTGADFDNPARIDIYDFADTVLQSINVWHGPVNPVDPTGNNPCLIVTGNVCVEGTVYETTVTLPPRPGGYQISYQRYSRNVGIANLVNPSAVGAAFYASIPDTALVKCNSSPEYINFPPIAICANENLIFDHSASDPDGDSLVYELCDPFDTHTDVAVPAAGASNPPFPIVNWGPGYSAQNPLDGTIAIDSFTGELTAHPTQTGLYVVGICVKEYRGDSLLSVHFRDFQFYVVDCIDPTAATIAFEKICGDLTVQFPDSSIAATTYFWDFGDTTTLADTSNLQEPAYTYPDTGVYNIILIVNKGTTCSDTAFGSISLKPGVSAGLSFNDTCTKFPHILTDLSDAPDGFITDWKWLYGNGDSSTLQNPNPYIYDTSGRYELSLIVTTNHGCIDTARDTIEVYPEPFVDIGDDTIICEFDTLFFPKSDPDADHVWVPEDYLYDIDSPIVYSIPQQDITYIIDAVSQHGCIYSDTVEIIVLAAPNVVAAPDTVTINRGETVQMEVEGALTYEWSPNTDIDDIFSTMPISDTKLSKTYHVIGTDTNGCTNIDSVVITVRVRPEIHLPTAFTPGSGNINDYFSFFHYDLQSINYFEIYNRWGKKVFEGQSLNDSWDGNHRGKPQEVGVYIVKASVVGLDNEVINYEGTLTLIR